MDYLDQPAEEMIGTPFRQVIAEEALHDLRTAVQVLSGKDAVERVYGVRAKASKDAFFDVAVHKSGEVILFEFQPHGERRKKDTLDLIRPMVDRLRSEQSIADLCQTAARQVRALTGFDRVMVYRFLPDESGEVLAEAAKSDLESFLGLRYPATDIPRQARELYKRSLLRIISNVDDTVSPIIPEANPSGEPLDLSMSVLRAVSPIHIEYLRNMGVKASMSISILDRGKLWGLFACHHYSPRVLDYNLRSASELYGQLIGFLLGQLQADLSSAEAAKAKGIHNDLMAKLAEGSSIGESFEAVADALTSVIDCDGVAGWIDGEFTARGVTPTKDEFGPLFRFLNTTQTSRVYATDSLQRVHAKAADFVSRAAGILAIPVSRTPRDYIVLCRREIAHSVTWAGNPDKPAELGPNGIRLTPRKSFEAWQEMVYGHSEPWADRELETAESLRVTLLEVVLRMSDAANQEKERSRQRQELLIAELNHRVRNILNLIRGLVNQSQSEARTVAEFTQTVGGRIHALARAHDQVTDHAWTDASLRDLIQTETAAYLGPKAGRIEFDGPDALVKPEAFTTLALVFHELMTNSAKYGALSDQSGSVSVAFNEAADGALELEWIERDGPPVSPPTRRGFGSTVIERSIPYELGGDAKVRYSIGGLVARFVVPSRYVSLFTDVKQADGATVAKDAQPKTSDVDIDKALVVEDNMIIALDAEAHLRGLGVRHVLTAADVSSALRMVDENQIGFAVLDLNLGAESSLPVAKKLQEFDIPFVFATGYGEKSELLAEFPGVPVLNKPYDAVAIHRGIADAIDEPEQ